MPIFRASLCDSRFLNLLVIEASAMALSADKTSSRDIMTGNRGANSTHLSIPSKRGVKEVSAAESIETCQFRYSRQLGEAKKMKLLIIMARKDNQSTAYAFSVRTLPH